MSILVSPFSIALQRMEDSGLDWKDLQKGIERGLYIPREKILKEPERPYCHRSCKTSIIVLSGRGILVRGHVEQMILKGKKVIEIFPGQYHCIVPMEEMVVWEVVPKHYLNLDVHWLKDQTCRCFFDEGVEKRVLVREYFRRRGVLRPTTEQIYNFSGPSVEEIRDQLRF